ncbi:MAG: DUF748 domain-containing protein [Deltaproteobacteria bacterium]|nr:DUF748 domain-containing protein [Deltaproteobacteria bacterium]
MNLEERKRGLRHLAKAAIALAALALVYTLAGFLVLPWIIRPMIEEKGSGALARKVRVGELLLNPWTLSATVRGLSVKDPDGEDFVRASEIHANLSILSLTSLSLHIEESALREPYIRIVRKPDGSFNFSDILERYRPKDKAPKEPKDPFPIYLGLFDVTNASFVLDDHIKKVSHKLKDASFSVSEFSTLVRYREKNVLFDLAFLADGAKIAVKALSRPFAKDRGATLQISVSGLDLPRYMAYAPLPQGLTVSSARLDLKTEIDYRADAKGGDFILKGRVTLSDLAVLEGADLPLASVSRIVTDIATSRLSARDIHVASVQVSKPVIHVRRDERGKTNLEKILASVKEQPTNGETATPENGKAPALAGQAAPAEFMVDNMVMEAGQVFFTDRSNSSPFSSTLSPINLTVANLSSQPEKAADFSLSVETSNREAIKASGRFGLSPLGASGRVSVSDISLKSYFPYYAKMLRAEPPEGSLSVSTDFVADLENPEPGKMPRVILNNLAVLLNGFAIREKGGREAVVMVPSLTVKVAEADLAAQKARVREIASSGGAVRMVMEKDGKVSLLSLVAPSTPARSGLKKQASSRSAAAPWAVDADKVRLSGYHVDFTDKSPRTPVKVRLSDLEFSASGLSTRKGDTAEMDFSARVQQKGYLQARGEVGAEPLSANLSLLARGLDIRTAAPYWQDLTGIMVTKGRVETKGRLTLSAARAGRPPRVNFSGDAAILDFASSDKKTREDFFNFASLRLLRIKAGNTPLAVSVDRMGLDSFYSRVVIHPDGSVNLKSLLPPGKSKAAPAPAASPSVGRKSPPPDVRIREFTLSRGRFNFTDNLIKPNYSANYTDMTGLISGLSTDENSRAGVNLTGRFGSQAPVTVKGEISPLIPKIFADIEVKVSDMELPAFSPYSGRFIGRLIEKGKLALTLIYKVRDNKLTGANKIVLDQFTLGGKVESPDATSLPVGLAIALLKDRNGVIDLDLAVTGDMNDPEFSVVGIVFKIIKNLIVKIVSSPFALLGSVFGGGEDLQFADFAAGKSEIGKETGQKLDSLEKALFERPGLTLDIRGDADPAADAEALRAIGFENLLKRQMLKKPDAEEKTLEDVTIPADQYPALIAQAFAASEFPKPVDKEGKPRPVPPQEMEALLRTHVRVTDGQLRILAHERAMAAKEYILGKGRVEAARVFILEPEPMTKAEGRKPRTTFSIR